MFDSDVLAYRVARALTTRGLEARRVVSAAEMRALAGQSEGVQVLTVAALSQSEMRTAVDEIRGLEHDVRFILLAHPEELTPINRLPDPCEVCLLPFELGLLPETILRTRFELWRTEMVRRIRTADRLPFILRAALVGIVRQRMPPVGAPGRRLRTVTDIAEHIGMSRVHLSRIASTRKWDLPRLADSYLALLAVRSREIGRHSWDAIAWQLGYESQAGLSRLMTRAVGAELRSEPTLESAMAAWDDRLEEHLAG
ncbi:MAG: hypothetical protein U5R14_11660 [Gemmatimonadota bacterium]|nr:hypothetical protein [Gemmatimonadota bacterium]